MSTRSVAVTLPSNSIYVSGTVNHVAVIWTNTEGNTWEAVADRAPDDVYRVELTIINSLGTTSRQSVTLYYSLHLVTDRTQADVARAKYLTGLWDPEQGWTGTPEELAEWLGGLKGAYNASDLNRVGAAVRYVSDRLTGCGYLVQVAPKTDWTVADIPTAAQLAAYLADVAELRGKLAVLPTTPETPVDMIGLTYTEANDIEKILEDVDRLITLMMQSYYYSGELFAGEV